MHSLTTAGAKEYSRLLLPFEHTSLSKCVFAPAFPRFPQVPSGVKIPGKRVSYGVFSARHTEC
jgi:hypothetical protein